MKWIDPGAQLKAEIQGLALKMAETPYLGRAVWHRSRLRLPKEHRDLNQWEVTMSLASQAAPMNLREANSLVSESPTHSFIHPSIYVHIRSLFYSTMNNLQSPLGIKKYALAPKWKLRGRNLIGREEPRLMASSRFGKLHWRSQPFYKEKSGWVLQHCLGSNNNPQTTASNEWTLTELWKESLECMICKDTKLCSPNLVNNWERGQLCYYYHDNHICWWH